jgi:predicted RND superfamily exporter protein
MLESLFDSQIRTLGFVFIAILCMVGILFRSLRLAVVALLPNILAGLFVLGLMGWFGVSLDIMTITIAAICVGMAVDNSIHYIYRFRDEFARVGDYNKAMWRSHGSIGRALYYTSATIIVGFSILMLSSFKPTIYFGFFTSVAMCMALLGALTFLPRLMLTLKPLKKP